MEVVIISSSCFDFDVCGSCGTEINIDVQLRKLEFQPAVMKMTTYGKRTTEGRVSAEMKSEVVVGLSLNEKELGKSLKNACVTAGVEVAGIGFMNAILISSVELSNVDFEVASVIVWVSFLKAVLSTT